VEVGERLFLLPKPPLKSAKRIFFFSFSVLRGKRGYKK